MTKYLILIYSGYFICSIFLSFLLNALFLRFSRTLGIRDSPELVRWATTQKPAVGGISFYVLFLLSIACYTVFFQYRLIPLDKKLLGLIGSVTLAFVMGLADDAYNTKPLLKFAVQIACGFILCETGFAIHLFENETLNQALTIFWVVGIMNSINMLDNMDAITASISTVILLEALVSLYVTRNFYSVHVIVILGVVGALGGFLFFNWHPSKLYMGDTGSQFLGILLAAIGIEYFWNSPDYGNNLIFSKRIIVTALGFLIPLCDTTIVVINRLAKKKAPWIGGKDHTTHHLSYLGLSDSQVAIAFCGMSVVSMMMIFVIQGTIVNWSPKHEMFFGGYILAVFGILFYVTKTRGNPAPADEAKSKQEE